MLQVCSGTLSVYEVEGDHESFLQGIAALSVASIINRTIYA